MKESSQDRKILSWIRDKYGNACKLEKRHADRYTERGLPDLSICVYGMNIQIEDKIIKEFPRDDQLLRMYEYQTAGAISFWTDSFEMFLEKWEQLVEGDYRFKFMKSEWLKREEVVNIAVSFLGYKEEQENNRKEWLKHYKEKTNG